MLAPRAFPFTGAVAAFAATALLLGLADAPALSFALDSQSQSPSGIQIAAVNGVVEIRGLPDATLKALKVADLSLEERSKIFNVRVASQTAPLPPMRGAWTAESDRLAFRPKYPLTPGVAYEARLDLTEWSARPTNIPVVQAAREFQIPEAVVDRGAPPVVAAVYPSSNTLPANQLKFYIHFSKPMQRGDVYKHIRLTRADGSLVEAAFLELGQELWDPAFQRFTLLIDPGRIKRGLVPHEEDGPVLEEGRSYALEIDQGWTDLHEQRLARPHRKTFRVGKEDREPIDPKSWVIETPAAGASDPVVVKFGESLDQALAQRLLTIVDERGDSLDLTPTLERQETQAEFRPKQPWKAGRYRLRIGSVLEDLAGNSVGQPFELDRFDSIDRSPRSREQTIERTFSIESKERHGSVR